MEVTIDAASIDTGEESRDARLGDVELTLTREWSAPMHHRGRCAMATSPSRNSRTFVDEHQQGRQRRGARENRSADWHRTKISTGGASAAVVSAADHKVANGQNQKHESAGHQKNPVSQHRVGGSGRASPAARAGRPAGHHQFPNNPTGATVDREFLEGVSSLCRQHGVLLYADEVYRGLPVSDEPCQLSSWDVAPGETVAVGSFPRNTCSGSAGGWLLAPPHVPAGVRRTRAYTSSSPSVLSEALALRVLGVGAALLSAQRAHARRNLAHVAAFMN